MSTIDESIEKLADYALEHHLISEYEKDYSINRLLDVLNLDSFHAPEEEAKDVELEPTLKELLDFAAEHGILPENTTLYRDLLDTKIMDCFTMRPDMVIQTFYALFQSEGSKSATDWYYQFSKDTDYIRTYRVKKDLSWKSDTPYGPIDITVNLSKPEKDPKAIAAARLKKSDVYPKCALCKENVGYRGRLDAPARETLRIIPVQLSGDPFYLQYSPYSYFPEHCIVFNAKHVPMVVNDATFRHLLEFVSLFPHYMLGSNADLPIVGGSILTHDHYQGGGYSFPMFHAKEAFPLSFEGFDGVKASYLYWPLSVIRLVSKSKDELRILADKILASWRMYSDPSLGILAVSEGKPHNTITPIVHFDAETHSFVLDLTLRNNRTSEEYPLGIFHPHAEFWNIKKENIGLIEVMGRAILPSRLVAEMNAVKEGILHGEDLRKNPQTEKHAAWAEGLLKRHPEANGENLDGILRAEIGRSFQGVLECAGVFKNDEEGKQGVYRFVDFVNAENA